LLPQAYTELFFKNPEYFFSLLFLTVARVLPIVAMAPFFGAKVMPIPARMGFCLCLFAILLPFIITEAAPIPWNSMLIIYVLKELLIGFIMGFLVMIPFNIIQMTGIVIDNQRGSSSLMGQDATTGTQVSTIGILYNSLLIVIFYSLNGPFIFLDALIKSYKVLPPEVFPSAQFFLDGTSAFWTGIIGIMAKVFAISSQLAAPALLSILMTDAFLGIINRLAPQVQISFLGQGLKAFFGDFAVYLSWFYLLEKMGRMSLDWMVVISDFITQLGVKAA
jgi:type III secretion protein T